MHTSMNAHTHTHTHTHAQITNKTDKQTDNHTACK